MTRLNINGQDRTVDVDPSTPVLWTLRDALGLTGTKFGCGMALCGACTVYLDGEAVRACTTPLSAVSGKAVTTVEALENDRVGRAVQQAWVETSVAQCGYCQAGQIMSAVALLKATPKPTDEQIDEGMSGNICRCGTYLRIRKAIHLAAEMQRKGRG